MAKKIVLLFIGLTVGVFVSMPGKRQVSGYGPTLFGPSLALAQRPPAAQVRGTARRTARRTTRRVNRRTSLPSGCVRRGAYYYCGGVYYQPLVENGTTVYIIVNP